MALKDMKQSATQMKETMAMPSDKPQEQYPYGLCIHLGKAELEKLGMKSIPKVGTVMTLDAKVKVVSTHQSASQSSENKGCDLQITHLEVEPPAETAGESAKKIYDNMGK